MLSELGHSETPPTQSGAHKIFTISKQRLKFETSHLTVGHPLKIKQIHKHRKTARVNCETIFFLVLFFFLSLFFSRPNKFKFKEARPVKKARQMVKSSSVSSKG